MSGEESLYQGKWSRAKRYLKRALESGTLAGLPAATLARTTVLLSDAMRAEGEHVGKENRRGELDPGALETLQAAFGTPGDGEMTEARRVTGVALADLLIYLGRMDDAKPVIDALLTYTGGDPEVAYLAGYRAYLTGDETTAQTFLVRGPLYAQNSGQSLQDKSWQISRSWMAIGLCYYWLDRIRRESQLNNALQCMVRARKSDPHNYMASVYGAKFSLEGNQSANARVTWLDPVLKENSEYTPARAMLARSWFYQWSSVQGAAEAFAAYRSGRETIDGLEIAAEAMINDQRYDLAWDYLDRALAINPRSLNLLTLKGLLHLYSGQHDKYAAVEKQVLELCPGYSEFYAAIANGMVEQHRFDEAIQAGHQGLKLDPKDWECHKALGFAYARAGDEPNAIKHLTEANQNDPMRNNLFTLNMLQALRVLDKNYGTYKTRDGRFIIRCNKGEEKALVPLLERELQKAWKSQVEKYGFEPKTPITIECFDRQDDFAARSVAVPGLPALGVCFGQLITILSPTLAQQEENPVVFSWARTLRHEMDHIFQIQLSNGRVPRWLAEGCSVYEERRARPEWDRELDEQIILRWHRSQLLKLGDINNSFRNAGTILYAYYQSSYMVEMIDKELGGYSKVVGMLKDFARDKPLPQNVQENLGISIEEFDTRFRAFIKERFIDVTKFEPQFGPDDLARFKIQYEDSPEDADLRNMLASAYLANNFPLDARLHAGVALRLDPGNRRAMLVMGRLLYLEGMAKEDNDILQQGRDYYEQALQMGVEDFQLFLDMAQLMGVEGDAEGAKDFLNMAKEAFPRYVGENNPYQLLAQLYQQEGNNDAALKEMEGYARIVEHEVQVRGQLVQFYMGRGDTQKALQYLQEIENVTPLNSQLQQQLAGLLVREERWAEAATAWSVILGMADAAAQHDNARRQLVQALFNDAQWDAALELCDSQLIARPGDRFWTQWRDKVKAAKGD